MCGEVSTAEMVNKNPQEIPDMFTVTTLLLRLPALLFRFSPLFHRNFFYFLNTYKKQKKRLSHLAFFTQIRVDENVNVPVKDCIHITNLRAGPVVLHKSVWLKDIRPDLISP